PPVGAGPGGAHPAGLRQPRGAHRRRSRAGQLGPGGQAERGRVRPRPGRHGRPAGGGVMTVVYIVCLLVLLAAAVAALTRVERGPSMFDRILGLDVTTAVLIGVVTLIAAATRRTDLVPVLVVLALVGFIGSTAIARFAVAETGEEGRILTREELEHIMADRAAEADVSADDEGGTVIVSVDVDLEDLEGVEDLEQSGEER